MLCILTFHFKGVGNKLKMCSLDNQETNVIWVNLTGEHTLYKNTLFKGVRNMLKLGDKENKFI